MVMNLEKRLLVRGVTTAGNAQGALGAGTADALCHMVRTWQKPVRSF